MIDIKSWLAGFLLGLCGKPLPFIQRLPPTAYSYNGVVLPDLYTVYTPERQKQFPYAAITYNKVVGIDLWFAELILSEKPATANAQTGSSYFVSCHMAIYETAGGTKGTIYEGQYPEGYWGNGKEYTMTHSVVTEELLWANYDMASEDGNVLLAKSQPIPVYE